MRNFVLISAVSVLSLSVAMPASAVEGATLDQRVKRLERMLENPVLLQLSRRLGEQQRDIQSLQDENDRLKRELKNLRSLMDKRYQESDERFSALEGDTPVKQSRDRLSSANPVSSEVSQAVMMDSVHKLESVATAPEVNAAEQSALLKEPKVEATTVSEAEPDSMALSKEGVVPVESGDKVVEASEGQAKMIPIQTHAPTEIEKEKYKEAFALMRASKYSASIKSFEEFLTNYPESDLASNAAYWSGEGYLIKDQNQAALDAFMLVIERYPDSSKVPDAKLRAGDAYDRLGQKEEAKKMYQDIIQSRPHSKSAKNAEKRLEKL